MKFTVNEICTLKLVSGEELIAKIIEVGDETITISSPVSVAPGPQGLGLIPSLFTSNPDAPVTLNINNVTMCSETEDSVKNKYTEATGQIMVPSKKLILG